jgi:YD repeat-containing protein
MVEDLDDSQNQFIDSKGSPVQLFSNQFYTNSVPSHCHTLLVGEAFINNGKVTESYYKYDNNGNMIEAKTLFPTRDYAIFSGTFDENGQTSFDIDLTGLTITDAILVISSGAVPTQETFYETHSEVGKGWLDTGSWSGKYFMANYFRCCSSNPPDCFDGSTKIGSFEHYPGTANYTGYTTWIEENTQYVKTSYTAIVNEYPETVEYNLNNSSWNEITDDLGSGTTSITVLASSFSQGMNALQFRESNDYSTRFEWALYLDQGAITDEYVTTHSYDSYGNLTSATDPAGHISTYACSADFQHAYVTSISDSLGNTVTISYEFTSGLITKITDENGNTSSYEYDLSGRIVKRINPDLTEMYQMETEMYQMETEMYQMEAVYDDPL